MGMENKTFIVSARPFGYEMFASMAAPGWSDRRQDAIVYDDRDNRDIKLSFWKGHLKAHGIPAETALIQPA
jgi:hypothetical protein